MAGRSPTTLPDFGARPIKARSTGKNCERWPWASTSGFTAPEKNNHIRTGDFATVERVEPDLSVRLDNGKSVDLDSEAARHIDYGYAVEAAGNLAADRVILTGEGRAACWFGE